ncbi:hypothetical protein [Polaribacter tangerinus]|uniref:hypothetical protein n=1 Tax=Polaribacter tangerinus TaxID=1920034 RepID=UPI000B4B4D5B|nr:hypothetical protein [Polaribacter tangerinus]
MKKFTLLAFLLCTTITTAQFTEVLTSDRPGMALSPNTVGKYVFQTQTGIDFQDGFSISNPNSYIRFGLSEKLEVNTSFSFYGSEFISDLVSINIGARYRFNSQNSSYSSSIQVTQFFYNEQANTSQLTYIFGGNFTDKLSYTTNLGISIAEFSTIENTHFVANIGYVINPKLGVFVESFGSIWDQNFTVNFDAGAYYLLSNNLQFDISMGDNNGFFTSAGVSWRIPYKK